VRNSWSSNINSCASWDILTVGIWLGARTICQGREATWQSFCTNQDNNLWKILNCTTCWVLLAKLLRWQLMYLLWDLIFVENILLLIVCNLNVCNSYSLWDTKNQKTPLIEIQKIKTFSTKIKSQSGFCFSSVLPFCYHYKLQGEEPKFFSKLDRSHTPSTFISPHFTSTFCIWTDLN